MLVYARLDILMIKSHKESIVYPVIQIVTIVLESKILTVPYVEKAKPRTSLDYVLVKMDLFKINKDNVYVSCH